MTDIINSQLWDEVAEANNPFAAAACYCRGYDVYGDMLGKASFTEYLYLLFKGERPAAQAARALDMLAVALANPGPRDPSVHAAICAGVGGSTAASALMAALAAGAGSYGGARDVLQAMEAWQACGTDLVAWRTRLTKPSEATRAKVWPQTEHVPGFDPYGTTCATPVRQTLALVSQHLTQGQVAWLAAHQPELEAAAGAPLAMTGVAAAVLTELGLSPVQGEMLTLLLRLPGAAAHALEQWQQGFRRFPFFGIELEDDPGPAPAQSQEAQA